MMVSDEQKRWLVVGIAMNKVAAPVLRDYIKQGMDTHYTNNTYCHGLTAPCTLKTLTYHHVNADPNLRRLKFQNVNNNLQNHGNHKNLYNYNINSSVDLAKLFLPEYLAEFSAFDESLDMSAILRLLGFNNPAPIFPSPNPLISIQLSADDVRENVRNKWGHCNVTDWTEVLFNDCFSKLETLVKSLGRTGSMEKTALDQLSDWKTKGCQLCMGHAVDQNLLSLVQQDVKELIKNFKKTEAEQTAIQETLAQQKTEQREMQSLMQVQLEEHDEQLEAVLEWKEQQLNENKEILGKLVSLEESRLQGVEDDLSEVKAHISQTDERVKQLEENVRDGKIKDDRSANSTVDTFDLKTCRSKLAEHYKRTAKVPTSVWSKTSPVDIHQIYTRLSWVKEEQTPAGSSKSTLGHYKHMFTANKNGLVPKRILVQGQTGIGKSTFVKKLAVDWAELDDEKTESKEQTSEDEKDTSSKDDEDTSNEEYEYTSSDEYEDKSSDNEHENQKATLKKFELVVVINLKEASKCRSLKDVVSHCHIFPREETSLVEGLLNYVTKNQENVLLVFDGYDEYCCGSNSEIYEIFSRKKLRNCCVLITTRISKADELREFKDVHAEITGFSRKDRKGFMIRMLGGEAEAKELRQHLSKENLTSLTRVPLLLLFFCTLWKKGKLKSFPETKTKLYLAIVQYVLDYNQGKHYAARFRKVEDFKEILAEIGKVALECLLKDEHVFEYDQLSTALLYEEGLIVGLLQVTEYAENLRPAGMVSFIHKSIQEFLAAWYIIYRCVPDGNLGEIEGHACTLEDCQALENVFQFICGLSDEGAVKVFQHFTTVRISDPMLDLSKIIPDVETETDVPLCDITYEHNRFSDLVYSCFQEVSSKAELFIRCLECTGTIVPVTEQVIGFLRTVNIKELRQAIYSGVYSLNQLNNFNETHSKLCKLLEALDLPDILPNANESSTVLAPKDKRKFHDFSQQCNCSFRYILCFRTGQFQFHITGLSLYCDDHSSLLTETTADSVQFPPAHLCSGQSRLKCLTSLQCGCCLSGQTLKDLGAAIRNSKHLKWIEVQDFDDDSICDLLEQVPNPSTCSLEIFSFTTPVQNNCHLTSAGAVKLAYLLPRFSNIITLHLGLSSCCSAAVDTLVTSISHKTLERLVLAGISLTPAAAAALGRSLPEMSSLQELELIGVDGSILQAEEIEVLFGGLKETLPLRELTFNGFSMIGCITPLIKSLCFFVNLRWLQLEKLHMDEENQCGLLESLRFISNITQLRIQSKPLGHANHCTARLTLTIDSFADRSDKSLNLDEICLTSAAAAALGRLLPEMSSLNSLSLTAVQDGSFLQTEELLALFGGFSRPLSLYNLAFHSFSVSGSIASLTDSLRYFPNLRELCLGGFSVDEHNLFCLLDSLRFVPNLIELTVLGKPLCYPKGHTVEVNTVGGVTYKALLKLALSGISLTPAGAAALGRILPEMLALEELKLDGVHGSILQAEEIEALFGGFNKTLPLRYLSVSGFSVTNGFAPLTNSFRFFPDLRYLSLWGLNGGFNLSEDNLLGLLESLRFIPNLKTLRVKGKPLSQEHCYTARVNTFASFAHVTLQQVNLVGISLTPALVAVLSRSLPEMSSLKELELTGVDGSIVQAEKMEELFRGFNKTLPLNKLTFDGFRVQGCLAPLTKSFRFFPDLREFNGEFNLDEHNLIGLLESLRFVPNLEILNVKSKPLSQEHCCTAKVGTMACITHKSLSNLSLDGISLTSAVAAALGRLLPDMSSLQRLELTGVDGSILQAEEMEALFGGFNKTLPLFSLTFRGFRVRGIGPLSRSFCFFPCLRELCLEEFSVDEQDVCILLENLRFMPYPRALSVRAGHLGQARCYTTDSQKYGSFSNEFYDKLNLDGISLTTAIAASLGRSLPEMSSLEELELTGVDGSILQAKEMKALFGGINKTLLLSKLTFISFSVTGCLAPLTESFRFFPNLTGLCLRQLNMNENDQCSLLGNLRFMPNLRALSIRADHQGQARCYTTESHRYGSFSHEVCDKLNLDGINLTTAVATALGRSLPEMSSLVELKLTGMSELMEEMVPLFRRLIRTMPLTKPPTVAAASRLSLPEMPSLPKLEFSGVVESVLQAKEMEALFREFNRTTPLTKLTFSDFSVTGCLDPLTKSLCFFPNLKELKLERLNMDEHDQCALLENFGLFRDLTELTVRRSFQDSFSFHYHTVELDSEDSSTSAQVYKSLNLDEINLTSAVAAALGRSLPEMLSLERLELADLDGSTLRAEEMNALFGGLNKTLPVYAVTFSGFSVRGCLAPFTNMLQFFPNLTVLKLENLDMDEEDFCSLLNAHSRTAEVNTMAGITPKTLETLVLSGISLTTTVAEVLGRSLTEMSSLRELKLTGVNGSILKTKEMEALFGGFKETMPLRALTFNGFSVRGCLAPLVKSVQFFPSLTYLNLEKLNMDEHDLSDLLAYFQCFPHLSMLNLSHNPLGHAVRSVVPYIINLQKLRHLWIDQTGPEEDLKYVRDTVQEALPELSTNSPRCNVM